MNNSERTSGFDLNRLKGDLFGGLTAGIVALPLALAFGEQTELGAISGLYGAIAIGIIAAIFGGTKTQISGPTAPMTVVSAVVIADAINYAGSFEVAFPIIIATFFLAGLVEMLFGVFRLGSYIKYIPYPVVSGFMTGIGVIIIISQIFPLLGDAAPSGGALGTLSQIHKIPEIANEYSIGIAILTLLVIYLFPKITSKIPSSLVALIAISLAAFFFFPADEYLRINSNGPIPSGLPALQLAFFDVYFDFNHLLKVFEYAFTLAALGAIDSLLTSVVADNMTRTKHRSNQELIGQGLGNMGAALIGGLPGAGATMRTVINIKTGGTTKLSGVIAGLLLVAVLLGVGQYVGHVPNAVLAGILIAVGISIVDRKSLKHFRSIPKTDLAVMLIVLTLTVFVDLLVAVAVGMLLAALLFMKQIADSVEESTHAESLKDFSREVPWLDDAAIIEEIGDKVYIKHLSGPLFFGFASRFQHMLKALPDVEVVVIRMEKVPYVDQSGLYAMEEGIMSLTDEGIDVLITGLSGQPLQMLAGLRIIPGLVPEEFVFADFKDCAAYLDKRFGSGVLIKNLKTQSKVTQEQMTPQKAIDYLKKGNSRFLSGMTLQRDLRQQIEMTTEGQYPFAAILSCIDSRAPIETILDQGIGDIFNARIAGNFVDEDILGSLEFACKVAGSKLIVVMGHTSCGAVKGACDGVELGNLTQMLKKIQPAVDAVPTKGDEKRDSSNSEFVDRVAEENVRKTIEQIHMNSPILDEMESNGEIAITGAMYDVKTGVVTFLDSEEKSAVNL